MTKICLGCGIELQTENPEKPGFIPPKKYNEASYCQKCFKLTHYGEKGNNVKTLTEKEIIKRINKNPKLTLFLIDLLNIREDVLKIYKTLKTPKVLIINKCEILPKFLKAEKLINYLRDNYQITDKIIIKGNMGREAEKVLNFIERNATSSLYLVGLSNSGKSTLINDLAKVLNSKAKKVTVSNNFNTTVDFLEINLTTSLTIIDTPGFFIEPILDIKKGKKIKSFVFQMKDNQVLNLTSEYYLKCLSACNINYFTDISNERVIKKNYKSDLEFCTELKIKKDQDLIIKGLGFISFKENTTIKINLDKTYLTVRKSIFGG